MRVFVTGASGWIGQEVLQELLGAGHQVVGLARSEASAAAVKATGAEVERGDLDDLALLRRAAQAADGVIHLAFKHDLVYSGDFASAADADELAIRAFGDALAGSNRPLLIASGVLGLKAGQLATELDFPALSGGSGFNKRASNAKLALDFAKDGVRSAVVRLAPSVHGPGDQGFMAILTGMARATGVSGYIGAGEQRWPGVHRTDAARLFRLGLEKATAGSVLHATAEVGVPIREIATIIGRQVNVPVVSIPPQNAAEHFSFMAHFLDMDSPTSSEITQKTLGWEITQPGLIADLEAGHYFAPAPTVVPA